MATDRGSGWSAVAAAALLVAVMQGFRSAFGLFVSPLNTATGLGLAAISFAVAASQLASGLAQPFAGRLADRVGLDRLIVGGAVATAAGIAVLPWLGSAFLLTAGMVAIALTGTALASAPLLLAVVMARVPAAQRGRASGVVGAGGSAGQLLFGPATQGGIASVGWVTTLFGMAAVTLAAGALAVAFRGSTPARRPNDRAGRVALHRALRDRDYWLLVASFFVCGFHVSFLLAHMPGFIAMCSLPVALSGAWLAIIGGCNIVGSLGAGWLVERQSARAMLVVLYALRGVVVLVFAALAPTPATVIAFAFAIGLTYMATLPPTTAALTARYGARQVATLFGLAMLLHQVGSFLGVWLAGVAIEATGSFATLWVVDGALAFIAAGCCLAMREPRAAPARAASQPATS